MNNVVKFKLIDGAKLPEYKTCGASGADICSTSDVIITSGERCIVPTGLIPEIPNGFELQIRPRSGLAAKQGVTVLNTPGTIDSDYRGEIKVILFNSGKEDFVIYKGDRIAQIVLSPVVQAVFTETNKVSETERNDGGLGSTGVK